MVKIWPLLQIRNLRIRKVLWNWPWRDTDRVRQRSRDAKMKYG